MPTQSRIVNLETCVPSVFAYVRWWTVNIFIILKIEDTYLKTVYKSCLTFSNVFIY